MSPVSRSLSASITGLLDLVEPLFELVDLGPVVIDHRVDDAMQQRDRAFARMWLVRSHSSLTCAMLRRWPSWTVTRKFGPRKKSVSCVSKACSSPWKLMPWSTM